MASRHREALLKRAIESIRASSGNPVRIIVVVNGYHFEIEVCDWLKSQPDIQFEYLATPSAPGAVLRGRELVQTDFFSTLDDDDEYLPHSMDIKLAALKLDSHADFLVGNAFVHSSDGIDSLLYDRLTDVPSSPLECLMRFNWLSSGNALFRTQSVGPSYFKDYHPFAEWTWLAYKLVLDGKRVSTLNEPVCRHNDTAGSLSKSGAYSLSYMSLFLRMLACAPPSQIERMIHRKMGAAYHDASVAALHKGRKLDAWRYHWQSLVEIDGLKYLSYTRHLLLA